MSVNLSDTRILEDVFGTKARVTLLRRLSRESQTLTARQLAQLTGLNHRTVVEALDPLTHLGVVEKRHAGPSYLYSLARESLIAQRIILPALEAESRFSSALRDEIIALFAPPAISIVLFGSLARGEEKHGSDVDVLVVMADGEGCAKIEERALEAGHSFYKRFRRPLSVHCVTLSDARRGGKAFLSEAKGEGETLFGKPPAELGMTMFERKTREVSKRDAHAYISKAEQFLRTMEKAAEAGDWDAVGLNAVHSVISAADALTACRIGEEERHRIRAATSDPEGGGRHRRAGQAVRILGARESAGILRLTPGRLNCSLGGAWGAVEVCQWP